MTTVYRISKGLDVGRAIVGSIELRQAFARDRGPGHYRVDERAVGPFPGRKLSATPSGKVLTILAVV